MAARRGGMFGRLQEAVEERTGLTVESRERVELLEAAQADAKILNRELDLLGWGVLDYMSNQPQEMTAQTRRQLAQKSRIVWMQDPHAGAAVDLMNDFTFGRGVPKPKAHDEEVQNLLDEAFDDPDNQIALTSYAAQVALGTDLCLQSNLFLLLFEGDDGKVKLGLLDHDSVETVVRDPENRLRVLYYMARPKNLNWDYGSDAPKVDYSGITDVKPLYYEHWRNVKDAEDDGRKVEKPPKGKVGEGRVYHVAINRTTEMAFGVPTMRRILRFLTAYNDFLKSRVDIAQAAASLIAKRKIKGTPTQLSKMAAKAISRESDLAGSVPSEPGTSLPPRNASIWNENESLELQPFKLDSGAANAAQDAEMLRGPISAATRFPSHYFGGLPGSLAGASAQELPVLKAIEARQEVFEGVFRWFFDRVIEKAVDDGKLDKYVDTSNQQQPGQAQQPPEQIQQAHEDQNVDEQRTERDLGYDFSMPSPLRRMMGDLVTAITNIAKTFDPNATNMELSKVLLNIALGEGLELSDPGHAVDLIFPEGYVDPAIAAAQQAQQPQANFFGPESSGMTTEPGSPGGPSQNGGPNPTDVAGNPYSAQQKSAPPEKQRILQQHLVRDRNGDLVEAPALQWPPGNSGEAEGVNAAVRGRQPEIDKLWNEDVLSVAAEELSKLLARGNGSG